MSGNNNSPFSNLFTGLNFNLRNFFLRHDNYLNTAFILSIIPLPFTAVIAMLISLIGIYFQSKNKFQVDEARYLLVIIVLSIINLFFVYFFYSFAAEIYFSFLKESIDNIKRIIESLRISSNPFIQSFLLNFSF